MSEPSPPFDLPIDIYDGQHGTEYKIWTVAALQEYAGHIGLKQRGMTRLLTHLARGRLAGNPNLSQLGYVAPFWPMVWVLSPTDGWNPEFPDAVLVWVDAAGSHAAPDEAKPRSMDFIPSPEHIEREKQQFARSAFIRNDPEWVGCDAIGIRQFSQRLLTDFRMTYTSGMAS